VVQGVSFLCFFSCYHFTDPFCSFSAAVSRLFELGVPSSQWVSPESWVMPTVEEQSAAKEQK